MSKTKKPHKPIPKSKRAHLVHHRHTAKVLHKSHTSYPLVLLLIMAVGVFLAFMTLQVRAADVSVTGRVINGPVPALPATILSPVAGQQLTSVPVLVSGSCDPGYVVRVYRNGVLAGSSMCSPAGQFSLSIDLAPGGNELRARIFNAIDSEGPTSDPVNVSYTPPITATPSSNEPFYVVSQYVYFATISNKPISWNFRPVGGTGPYTVQVVWGDGFSEERVDTSGSGLTFEHTYGSPPNQREYYPVNITVTDANGRKAYLQVFTIVNDTTLLAGFQSVNNGGMSQSRVIEDFLWPAYIVTFLLGVAFWLGELRGRAMATRIRIRRVRNA